MFECEILVYHIHVRIIVQIKFGGNRILVRIWRYEPVQRWSKKVMIFFFVFVFQKSFSTIFFYCDGFNIVYRTDGYNFFN